MSSINFVQRAYELADSGNYSRVSEIRAVMTREGFSLRQLSQLSGKQLAQQLKDRMAAAHQSPPL
jgi:hypothetical protein